MTPSCGPDVAVGTARCAVRAAFSGAILSPTASLSELVTVHFATIMSPQRTFPELSNFASPPAKPKDYLVGFIHIFIQIALDRPDTKD
jgi:hypothetical protein